MLALPLEEDSGVEDALVLEEDADFEEPPLVEEEVFLFAIEPMLRSLLPPFLFLTRATVEGRLSTIIARRREAAKVEELEVIENKKE